MIKNDIFCSDLESTSSASELEKKKCIVCSSWEFLSRVYRRYDADGAYDFLYTALKLGVLLEQILSEDTRAIFRRI